MLSWLHTALPGYRAFLRCQWRRAITSLLPGTCVQQSTPVAVNDALHPSQHVLAEPSDGLEQVTVAFFVNMQSGKISFSCTMLKNPRGAPKVPVPLASTSGSASTFDATSSEGEGMSGSASAYEWDSQFICLSDSLSSAELPEGNGGTSDSLSNSTSQ